MILCCSKMSEVNAERNSQVDELTRGKKGENEKEMRQHCFLWNFRNTSWLKKPPLLEVLQLWWRNTFIKKNDMVAQIQINQLIGQTWAETPIFKWRNTAYQVLIAGHQYMRGILTGSHRCHQHMKGVWKERTAPLQHIRVNSRWTSHYITIYY